MTGSVQTIQKARNEESRGRWLEYAAHRERITHLLLGVAPPGGRLLILGAGNCNDIDLARLLSRYEEIHLVDLDGDAMTAGIQRQGLANHSRIHLCGGCDVTGVAEAWETLLRQQPDQPVWDDSLLATVQSHIWSFCDGLFDVVASIGLLSQLLEMVLLPRRVAEAHERELWQSLRLQHLRLLMESVRPGGRALLVSEILSSVTCPELVGAAEEGLAELVLQQIERRNFFTGLNPAVLAALWRESPLLARWTERVEVSRPWRWNFGPRVYACCAVAAVRSVT